MERTVRFKPQVEMLARQLRVIAKERNHETSPVALVFVRDYVRKELLSYGFEVHEEPFTHTGQTFSNLIARWPGTTAPDRLIVGAHFDAVPGSPGADDNASGVAALLECARCFSLFQKESPSQTSVPAVEFAAFDLEEYGMIGSRVYAEKLWREQVRILGMLSLEMVGFTSHEKGSQKMPWVLKPFYPDVGNFIGLVANTKSKKLLERVAAIFRSVESLPVESLTVPADGRLFPEARLSDHSPFWDRGYPALLITDTTFFRNPYYHSAEDRVETLDLAFLAKVTEAVLRVTRELGV